MFHVEIQTPGNVERLYWQSENTVRRLLIERAEDQTIYVFELVGFLDDRFGTHPATEETEDEAYASAPHPSRHYD